MKHASLIFVFTLVSITTIILVLIILTSRPIETSVVNLKGNVTQGISNQLPPPFIGYISPNISPRNFGKRLEDYPHEAIQVGQLVNECKVNVTTYESSFEPLLYSIPSFQSYISNLTSFYWIKFNLTKEIKVEVYLKERNKLLNYVGFLMNLTNWDKEEGKANEDKVRVKQIPFFSNIKLEMLSQIPMHSTIPFYPVNYLNDWNHSFISIIKPLPEIEDIFNKATDLLEVIVRMLDFICPYSGQIVTMNFCFTGCIILLYCKYIRHVTLPVTYALLSISHR